MCEYSANGDYKCNKLNIKNNNEKFNNNEQPINNDEQTITENFGKGWKTTKQIGGALLNGFIAYNQPRGLR